jgi:hypothetical protein
MFEGQLSEYPTRDWWPVVWNCANQIAGFCISVDQEISKSLDEFPADKHASDEHLEYLAGKIEYFDNWLVQIQGYLVEISSFPLPKKNIEAGFHKWLKPAVSAQFGWVNIARNSFVYFIQARAGIKDLNQMLIDIRAANKGAFELTQVLPRTLDFIQKEGKWPSKNLIDEKTEYNRIIHCEARLQNLQKAMQK